ncbi:MAG: di-heme oxidoredictase family protein [Polyangiales bacterium]
MKPLTRKQRLAGATRACAVLLVAWAHGCTEEPSPELLVDDATEGAFGSPMPALQAASRARFFVGNSFFNQSWVSAPASVSTRDGLGPLFNARSCSGCHFRDGRGDAPAAGEALRTQVVRISVAGRPQPGLGAPTPDPVYGDQLQTSALPGVPREARARVTYEVSHAAYTDGEPYALRQPQVVLDELGYGPPSAALALSVRAAPQLVGLGLLEAVSERDILARADPDDADDDGISGRAQWVESPNSPGRTLGRFGWKAERASLSDQAAAAFSGDMGITSHGFPEANHTARQRSANTLPDGGSPELDDTTLADVVHYLRTLAVPAPRARGDREQRGSRLFERAGCPKCHTPILQTSPNAELPALRARTFAPYTDLLLHDLGEALSDQRSTYAATGGEWRTAPLAGIGLVARVNPRAGYLHDGRARSLAEAILHHAGEAAESQRAFTHFPRADREALLAFVESL